MSLEERIERRMVALYSLDNDHDADLLKETLERIKDDRYWMTEIRGMVRPIIQNAPAILEAATRPS